MSILANLITGAMLRLPFGAALTIAGVLLVLVAWRVSQSPLFSLADERTIHLVVLFDVSANRVLAPIDLEKMAYWVQEGYEVSKQDAPAMECTISDANLELVLDCCEASILRILQGAFANQWNIVREGRGPRGERYRYGLRGASEVVSLDTLPAVLVERNQVLSQAKAWRHQGRDHPFQNLTFRLPPGTALTYAGAIGGAPRRRAMVLENRLIKLSISFAGHSAGFGPPDSASNILASRDAAVAFASPFGGRMHVIPMIMMVARLKRRSALSSETAAHARWAERVLNVIEESCAYDYERFRQVPPVAPPASPRP